MLELWCGIQLILFLNLTSTEGLGEEEKLKTFPCTISSSDVAATKSLQFKGQNAGASVSESLCWTVAKKYLKNIA